jgi:DNA-binding response OmpR family regulator
MRPSRTRRSCFLTGDPDPERQFEALESGADDFLSKPIRPRHLIAAVHSRIKRARMPRRPAQRRRQAPSRDQPLHRPHVLQRARAQRSRRLPRQRAVRGNAQRGPLRERYGYAGFEQLINQAGRRVAALAGIARARA